MKHIRSALECLFIVLFQTAVLHLFPFSGYFFDPAIPFVLYLGLSRPTRSAITLSLSLGLIMDGVSGAPFGVYTTTYVWMTAALRWMTAFIHADQFWMIRLLAGLGVLFESSVMLGVTAMVHPQFSVPLAAADRIGAQALMAALLGPYLFSLFHRLQAIGDAPANGPNQGIKKKRWLIISRA